MKFKDWKITINGKGTHNVVASDDTLLILHGYQHVEIALKFENDTIQVKSLGYDQDATINPTTKEIIVNVTDLLEDDE
ncbi:hypothetical protein [Staphylococcus ratti]|uniref:Phage protein n=1 Tax=Staphylococcus ratti TaxID=2892440 RepID=A0ABY3PEY1_9STAP|nr:hypothetical protein [Staphylococcus ratti]UEX90881.1 hypothetical protein LN051_04495 [Staphylococcus ratti]